MSNEHKYSLADEVIDGFRAQSTIQGGEHLAQGDETFYWVKPQPTVESLRAREKGLQYIKDRKAKEAKQKKVRQP